MLLFSRLKLNLLNLFNKQSGNKIGQAFQRSKCTLMVNHSSASDKNKKKVFFLVFWDLFYFLRPAIVFAVLFALNVFVKESRKKISSSLIGIVSRGPCLFIK